MVTVSREAAYTEGSSMYLKVGEKLTLETLLYGLLLCSGNDAAVAIAEHISGSQEDFAKLMNATARRSAWSTPPSPTPTGLDMRTITPRPGTWRVLPARRVENETLVRMASTRSVTIGGRNHDQPQQAVEPDRGGVSA